MSTAGSEFTDICLRSNVLPAIADILTSRTVQQMHKKEAAWILTNIAAGTKAQAAQLCLPLEFVDNPLSPDIPLQFLDNGVNLDTFDVMLKEIEEGQSPHARKECVWAFANAVSTAVTGIVDDTKNRNTMSVEECEEMMRKQRISVRKS
jgi:hypothetical protein